MHSRSGNLSEAIAEVRLTADGGAARL